MSSCFNIRILYPGRVPRNILKQIGSSVSFGDFSNYGNYKNVYIIIILTVKKKKNE